MDFPAKSCFVFLGLTLLLSSCNGSSKSPVAEAPTPTPSASVTPASPAPTPSHSLTPAASAKAENYLISPRGIGVAQLGMTLGDLKQMLGSDVELKVESPFIVDFDALAVRKSGEVEYYILYLAGQSLTDKDTIQGLLTNNAKFQTAEKVGPGTSLTEAERAYGKVTLSYNTQNESREYARFANQPAGNISFSTGNGNTSPAGIYASKTGDYNETEQFKDNAAIQSVLVVCLTDDCAQPATNR